MITWNLEKTASVCRERTGGAGFLACNKFAEYISIAHAAATAEGDNRVLMAKIVKDYIFNINSKARKVPTVSNPDFNKADSLDSLEILHDIFKAREAALFRSLTRTLSKETKEKGRTFYDVWFHDASDNI